MKKALLFSLAAAFLLQSQSLSAQNLCRVLMPSIGDSYTGSCKQGLADGKGEAYGADRYIGEFKKGLPDGEGSYFWQTGEIYNGQWKKGMKEGKGQLIFKTMLGDSIVSGIWKADRYVGKQIVSPYVIGYRNNVGRMTFTKLGGDQKYVKYKITRSGESSLFLKITDLMMQGSSGTETMTTNFTGYEDVTFPFEGKVQFTAPNALNTSVMNCEARFIINEPGMWLVTIYY